jgi:phosphatidate cytidylyltransferase
MNNLLQRILTALLAGSAAVAAIYFHPLGIWFFCMVVGLVGLWEFLTVMNIKKRRYRLTIVALGALVWGLALMEILLTELTEIAPGNYLLIGLLLFPLVSLLALFDKKVTEPVNKLGKMLMGTIYCFLPLVLLFKLSVPEIVSRYDPMLPLGILFLTWVLDSGAYFVGRFLGKHPLFPRISPKKTWEGAIGGAVLTMGLAWALQLYHAPEIYSWWIIAGIICVFSQLGDLVESMFKRSIDLKDSGSILPGHGGMLDRFDGIYLSVPFIFFYLSVV